MIEIAGAIAPNGQGGGVIACVHGLLVGFVVHRDPKLADIPALLADAVEMTAAPICVLACSAVFGVMRTAHRLGFVIGDLLSGIADDPLAVLLVIVAAMTPVGIVLDGLAAPLIVVPIPA